MKLVDTLSNIEQFTIRPFLFTFNSSLNVEKMGTEGWSIHFDQKVFSLLYHNQNLYVSYFSKEDGFERIAVIGVVDRVLKQNKFIERMIFANRIFEDCIFVQFFPNGYENGCHLGLFDFNHNNLVWSKESGMTPVFISERCVSIENSYKIISFSLSDGLVLWEYNIRNNINFMNDEYLEARQFLGVHNHQIWQMLSNDKILVLNSLTGEPINIIDNQFRSSGAQNIYFNIGLTKIDCQKNKAIGLSSDHYWEIDMENFSVLFLEVKEEYKLNAIFGNTHSDYLFDDKYIYFRDLMENKVAIFDKNNKKIVWVYECKDDQGNKVRPKKIDKGDRFLYILDGKGTLSIFDIIF